MQPVQKHYDVGVLVGRFQVHDLHAGHRELIEYVVERHSKVIIFLGRAPIPISTNNPLDFESRKQMIAADFPNVTILFIDDHPSDEQWSKNLDKQIAAHLTPAQSAVIYGSRDSFIAHYSGKRPTQELLQTVFESGTKVRKDIARSSAIASPDFRAGVIWASQGRFPTSYQCVDIAVLDQQESRNSARWHDGLDRTPPTKVLLGRKPTDQLLRFFGGFVDPADPDFETAAVREVREEAGVEVGNLKYVGSANVPDWRYKGEPDCIKTALFTATYVHGRPEPLDDLEGGEVRWVDLQDLKPTDMVPQHRHLLELLLTKGL